VLSFAEPGGVEAGMIYLGLQNSEKRDIIHAYCQENTVQKTFIFSPEKFQLSYEDTEVVEWKNLIRYIYFYRLLREIDKDTLVIVNECLRTQNRNDLTYNCMRHFLNQTDHQIIFQYLPIIESLKDFFILFDFDTKSRWKKETRTELLPHAKIEVSPVHVSFRSIRVPTPDTLKARYQKEKQKLFDNIGLKDPHTIPRNLYLLAGKEKLNYLSSESQTDLFVSDNGGQNTWYIGRNNRFKIEKFQTFREKDFPHERYTVFEFCHNFIDFCDFISLSHQYEFDVLAADLKVEQWYIQRYSEWAQEIDNVYSILQQ